MATNYNIHNWRPQTTANPKIPRILASLFKHNFSDYSVNNVIKEDQNFIHFQKPNPGRNRKPETESFKEGLNRKIRFTIEISHLNPRKAEKYFKSEFLRICRIFHPPFDNGTDNFPFSIDGIPYKEHQLEEIGVSIRNRLR